MGFEGCAIAPEIVSGITPEELGFRAFSLSDPVTQTFEIHTRLRARRSRLHGGSDLSSRGDRSGGRFCARSKNWASRVQAASWDYVRNRLRRGFPSKPQTWQVASRLLANPVVQRWALGAVEPVFPGGSAQIPPEKWISIHTMDEAGLAELNRSRRAALDPEELKAIRDYFAAQGRACSDVEFEMIAQTWSEHCFHKTFKALIDVEKPNTVDFPSGRQHPEDEYSRDRRDRRSCNIRLQG